MAFPPMVTTWGDFYVGAASAVFAAVPLAAYASRRLWQSLVHQVAAEVREINHKVSPNGGNTGNIGDRVARIEQAVTELVAAKRTEVQPCGSGSGSTGGTT